MITMNGQEHKG